MTNHKIIRQRVRLHKRGLMVVHHRWLSLDGEIPERWAAWRERRGPIA